MEKIKILTQVGVEKLIPPIKMSDKIFVIGSCFAENIGAKLLQYGFDVEINPFGTLYNVCSIYNSIRRLRDKHPFTEDDIVLRPDGLYVTFSHHSRFGNRDRKIFFEEINKSLSKSAERLQESDIVIITFGTSYLYFNNFSGKHTLNSAESLMYSDYKSFSENVVSNCHKFPAQSFLRIFFPQIFCTQLLRDIKALLPDKRIILTLSPIRHLADGAHQNQLSKGTLLMSIDEVLKNSENLFYFPSYEIMLDELRDYRWYNEDMIHPSDAAVKYIFERFKESWIDQDDYDAMEKAHKEYLLRNHRPLSK